MSRLLRTLRRSVDIVDLGFGRVHKMNLLFPSKMVRRVLPDADEEDCDPCSHELVPFGYIPVDGISSEMLDPCYDFECADDRDNRIFGDEEDDPANPNGDPLDILIAAEESAAGFGDECNALYTNKNGIRKYSRFVLVRRAGFGIRRHVEDRAFLRKEPVEAFDVDAISFAQASQQCYGVHHHAYERLKDNNHPHESHGLHGRKKLRPKHVTVRGARVRADIISSTRRGPRCVGLVATPRKCT